MSVYLEF